MLRRFFGVGKRPFDSLSEQEILALAVSSGVEDARIHRAYADGLRDSFPASARVFTVLAAEEDAHRRRLIDLHRIRFGDAFPLIRREHVRGYFERAPDWLVRPLGLEKTRAMAARMEQDAARFYAAAAARATDAATRLLLGDLAATEAGDESLAARLEAEHLPGEVRAAERDIERRQFILTSSS